MSTLATGNISDSAIIPNVASFPTISLFKTYIGRGDYSTPIESRSIQFETIGMHDFAQRCYPWKASSLPMRRLLSRISSAGQRIACSPPLNKGNGSFVPWTTKLEKAEELLGQA
jgi:hypothetical protein